MNHSIWNYLFYTFIAALAFFFGSMADTNSVAQSLPLAVDFLLGAWFSVIYIFVNESISINKEVEKKG